MRVSSTGYQKQQVELITKKYAQMGELQTQISTGEKFQKSSADPVIASRIKRIESYLTRLNSYNSNAILADKRTGLLETVTRDNIELMNRTQELLQAANNGTLNNGDRVNIANALQGCLDSLYRAANTTDSNGEYIFSGISSQVPAYSFNQGKYQYTGSMTTRDVDVGPNTSVRYGESGFNVFGGIKLGNGTFTVSANTSNTGTGVSDVGYVTNPRQYAADTYTLSFVTNAAGKLAYQVVGSQSGQVIPLPPAVVPTDAPEYVNNTAITFNGISFVISGQPQVGDVFTVAPSATQDIFTTLQHTIQRLQQPIYSATDQALFQTEMGQYSTSVRQAATHFIENLSEIGARSSIIQAQSDQISNLVFAQEVLYSKLAHADPVKVASDLAQVMNALEMMQQTYSKIQEIMASLIHLS